jgi:hypothetical protein
MLDDTRAREFAESMIALEAETLKKITDISKEYSVNPLEAIKHFSFHLLDVANRIEKQVEEKGGK